MKTTKSTVDTVHQILQNLLDGLSISKNSSDTLLNVLELTLATTDSEAPPIGVQILNKSCYIPPIIDSEPQVRRSVEMKQHILEDLFGWQLLILDEAEFTAQDDKVSFLRSLLGIEQ